MKIAIIGGGASGLCAAISALRKNAEVTVFERNDRVGKKILMTGNGKCNLSNIDLSSELYYTGDRSFISAAFERFGLNDCIMFFNGLGLLLTEKRGGIYPHSEQASAVLDALRFEATSLGAVFKCECLVKRIEQGEPEKKGITGGYTIHVKETSDSGEWNNIYSGFDKVIITTGGKAAPKTGSDGTGYELAKSLGHSVTDIYPALCGVKCEGSFWKQLAGVRCQAGLLIENESTGEGVSFGELQFTDYGISGIPVFQISRLIAGMLGNNKKTVIDIDLIPDVDEGTLMNELSCRIMLLSDRSYEQILNGFINKKLSAVILKNLKLNPAATFEADEKVLSELVNAIKHFRVTAKDMNSFDQAQTTAGGVPLSEIKNTFESKLCQGLFFAGEILDVDGICGGYNLQWAWTSGFIAGEEASGC